MLARVGPRVAPSVAGSVSSGGQGDERERQDGLADVAAAHHVVDVKVRDLVRDLEADGLVQVRQVGSHPQFRHPTKPGTLTVPGNPGDDMAKGTVGSVVRPAGLARRQR